MPHVERLAKEIVTELTMKGFTAYFAGGFVRDKLLGIPSSDIDIATNALPEEIAAIFPEHFLVGAQFGVCVVRHKGHSFEVATFRQDLLYQDGRRPEAVILRSTPEEDAKRRDFTVNGMFFNPLANEILDFVNGQGDLKLGIIRTIGSPVARFEEDRLRMIRAIRFAFRLGFTIEDETKNAIKRLSHTLLPSVSMERIWQEFSKIRLGPRFTEALQIMAELGILGCVLPPLRQVSPASIEERLSGVEMVSEHVPMILILSTLFNKEDLAFVLGLGIYLRASKEETRWIELYLEIKGLFERDPNFSMRFDWANLLADKRANSCLELIFHKLAPAEKERAFMRLADFENRLSSHIERLHKRKPLCQAKDLKELGISPGKKMGALLQRAERLAVELDLNDRQEVIKRLMQDPSWIESS